MCLRCPRRLFRLEAQKASPSVRSSVRLSVYHSQCFCYWDLIVSSPISLSAFQCWLIFKMPPPWGGAGDPTPNCLWTLSAPGAGKGLFRPCMDPAPISASIPCSHVSSPHKAVTNDRPCRDQTVNTTGQGISLNTNTAFKCVSHILGNRQFFQTLAFLLMK